jgi:hypothetical protein
MPRRTATVPEVAPDAETGTVNGVSLEHSPDVGGELPVPSREELLADLDARADRLNGQAVLTTSVVPEHDPWDNSFEIAADVKAVRGKNTADGPALEIVLDASIDSHIGQVMALIGKSFTRVTFRAYVAQPSLPFDTVRKLEPEPAEESAEA